MGILFDQETRGTDWRAYHARLNDDIPIADVLAMLGCVDAGDINGRNVHVLCPIHGDRDPSLYVHPAENSAYCFGACQRWYHPIDLWAAGRNLSYIDAADDLAAMYRIDPDDPHNMVVLSNRPVYEKKEPKTLTLPEPMSKREALFYHSLLQPQDYDMFASWGLDRYAVDAFKLGHTPRNEWPPAYTFPVWGPSIGGRLYAIRFRRDDEMATLPRWNLSEDQEKWIRRSVYWGTKGRNEPYPFGLWSLDVTGHYDYVWIVESEKTVLALTQWGVPAVTLTGGIGSHPNAWFSWRGYIDKFTFWPCWYDNDAAGRATLKLMQANFPDKVRGFYWLEEWAGLDAVQVIDKFGFEAVFEHMQAVVSNVQCRRVRARESIYWLNTTGVQGYWQDA